VTHAARVRPPESVRRRLGLAIGEAFAGYLDAESERHSTRRQRKCDLEAEPGVKAVRLDLAESALHAPQAAWGGVEFYPSFPMKAAVLLGRLTKNHALPDGNSAPR
jgi:hypothetical protein